MTKSELKRLPKGDFELRITVLKEEVAKTYEEVITKTVAETELPGFRKGKAPRDKVEPTLDKAKVYEEVIKVIVPQAYLEAIKEHGLRPMLNPRVKLDSVKEDEDWTFTAASCEAPEVKLGDYKAEVKKAVAADSLWVPGKGDPSKPPEEDKDKKLNKIVDHLLTVVPIDPSDMLVEEEANHSLSRLVDQTQQLGLTVEQYMASTNKTPELLRSEYAQAARKNLQVEFLLNAISRDLDIKVEDKDVDDVVKVAPDEGSRQALNTPQQRSTIKAILARRKALDTLLSFS